MGNASPFLMARNGQDLLLGLGTARGGTAVALEGELQNPGMLMDLTIYSSQLGLVTEIKVAGQSLMCSDVGMDITMFDPQALMEGHRHLGIPLDSRLPVRVEATLAAAGTCGPTVGVDPVDRALVRPINELPQSMLAYCFGLGSVVVGATSPGQLVAVARRRCMLGRIGLSWSASPEDLVVRGISINQMPMLAGNQAVGSTDDELAVGAFSAFATDMDGLIVGKVVNPNERVVVDLYNYNAAARTVYGGIFCLPLPPA